MSIQRDVHRYIEERPGVSIFVEDVARDLGITTTQVSQSVHRIKALIAAAGGELASIGGGTWLYRRSTTGNTERTLFELIGQSKTGAIVIQDEDGNLYVANAL